MSVNDNDNALRTDEPPQPCKSRFSLIAAFATTLLDSIAEYVTIDIYFASKTVIYSIQELVLDNSGCSLEFFDFDSVNLYFILTSIEFLNPSFNNTFDNSALINSISPSINFSYKFEIRTAQQTKSHTFCVSSSESILIFLNLFNIFT